MKLSCSSFEPIDQLALKQLSTLGPKTRFQLLNMGMKYNTLRKLIDVGVFAEVQTASVIPHYAVRDGFFNE